MTRPAPSRRKRLLLAFLAGDLLLAGVVAVALKVTADGLRLPDVPLPAAVAALPTLKLGPQGPQATYPATLTDLPPTATGTPAAHTPTRGPVASETLTGGTTATPMTGTPTATTTGTPVAPPTGTARLPPAGVSTATRTTAPPPANPAAATNAVGPTATASPSQPPPPTPTLAVPTLTSAPPPTAAPTVPPPLPPGGFVGMNGGPLEGNNSFYPYQGNLSHDPTLRAASFGWLAVAGVQWYRNYGSDSINHSWAFVEPQPGVFDWTAWDILVTAAQNDQINLLASIGNSVPAWANGTSNWRQPPSDLHSTPWENTAWYKFVTALVERYDGDGQSDMPGLTRPVKYWEVWNEPDLRQGWNAPDYPAHQFNGTAQDYARLLAVAYAAIKRADPAAQVVGPATAQIPGFGYSPVWTMWDWAGFVNAGGLNAVDILSFHVYFDRTEWDAAGVIDLVLNAVDANRGGKPVWITETGWEGNPGGDHADKARNLVRSAVMFWARPFMDRYFWYSWQESETHEGSDHKGLLQTTNGVPAVGVEPDPLFHPAYRALDVMNRVLAGYGPAERPVALDVGGAARAYKYTAGGREVWVAWHRPNSGTTTISLDPGGRTLRMIGLYGEDLGTYAGGALTVGPDPLYLTTDLNWSASLGRIGGRVRRAALGAVWANGAAGVTVQLTGPVAATTTTTDATGNYLFEFLPEGTYIVSVAGAASQTATVGRELPWGRTSFVVP